MTKRNVSFGIAAVVALMLLLIEYVPRQIDDKAVLPLVGAQEKPKVVTNGNEDSSNMISSAVMAASAPFNNTLTPSSSIANTAISSQVANDKNCKAAGYLWCECEEDISKLPISAPQGMTLISVDGCRRGAESNDLDGSFYFKGEAIIKGMVVREMTDVLGDYISFNSKEPHRYNQFSSAIYSLKFWDDPIAVKKFGLPPLSDKVTCWAAEAVIKVRELEVLSGGTDEAGNYPKDFDVLEVGEYKQCLRD